MIDYYSAIEDELKSYPLYKKSIGHITRRCDMLKERGGAEPVVLQKPFPHYMTAKHLDERYGVQLEYVTLCNNLKSTKDIIATIDRIIAQLDEQSRNIITLVYLNGESIERACELLGAQAPKTLYRYKNIAVEKFASILYSNKDYLSKLL